ncbi:MAG TPA: hypothetical protein VL101_09915, partial [Nordella sp.]|nr:hypothetical protein [Nordella sp.]
MKAAAAGPFLVKKYNDHLIKVNWGWRRAVLRRSGPINRLIVDGGLAKAQGAGEPSRGDRCYGFQIASGTAKVDCRVPP